MTAAAASLTFPDGTAHHYARASATRLGDYVTPSFIEREWIVTDPALPGMVVRFRPDADGSHDQVVFEFGMNSDPAGDPTAAKEAAVAKNLGSYIATISDDAGNALATVNVPSHWWKSRWRWQSAPRPIVNSPAQLIAQKLVPPYGVTGGKVTWLNPANCVYSAPMDAAGVEKGMPNTGERPDIGLVTEATAAWLLTGTLSAAQLAAMTSPQSRPAPTFAQAEAMMRAQAEASASVPWNYRDVNTGAVIDLSNPKYCQANSYQPGYLPQPTLFDPVTLKPSVPQASDAAFTASCVNGVMAVSTIASGTLQAGAAITDAPFNVYTNSPRGVVPNGLAIASQLSGTTGGVGTYELSSANANWNSATLYANPYWGIGSGWQPDNAHFPSLSYVVYLATLDRYHLEGCQFEGVYGYLPSSASSFAPGKDPRFPNGAALPPPGTTRAFAWTLRSALYARRATELAETHGPLPSTLLPSTAWKTLVGNAAIFLNDWVNDPTPIGTVFSVATRIDTDEPWMGSYLSVTLSIGTLFGYAELAVAAAWKAQNPIRFGNGKNGWPQAYLSIYVLSMGPGLYDPVTSDPVRVAYTPGSIAAADCYPSIAAAWADLSTSKNGNPPYLVAAQQLTQAQIAALNADPTNDGNPMRAGDYLVEARGALALAATIGVAGALDALAIQDEYIVSTQVMTARWSFVSPGVFTTPPAPAPTPTPTTIVITPTGGSPVSSTTNQIGKTLNFSITCFDQNGKVMPPPAGLAVTWSNTGTFEQLSPNGLSATLTGEAAGVDNVSAVVTLGSLTLNAPSVQVTVPAAAPTLTSVAITGPSGSALPAN